jgi:hypothetical protein
MSIERIEALERALAAFGEQVVALAEATTAQAVVCRAAVDLLSQAGISIDDVRDRALVIAAGMPGEIDGAVRTLLAETPAGAGMLQ